MKGQLKTIERLIDDSDRVDDEYVIARKFFVSKMTNGTKHGNPNQVLMEMKRVGQGLYLESFDSSQHKKFNYSLRNDSVLIELVGNKLDHKFQKDFYNDFMYGYLKASKNICFDCL